MSRHRFAQLSKWFHALPAPGRALVLMVFAGAVFAVMTAVIRHMSASMHPLQIVFFRCFFGLLFMLPWLVRVGRRGLATRRIGMHSIRAVFAFSTMAAWFITISLMPLGEAVALQFTAPLFGTLIAIVFLGEKVGYRRWTAIAIGFLGVLVILRPGLEMIRPAAFIALFSAATMAAAMVCVRSLTLTEGPNAVVTYMALYLTPISLVAAMFFWRWPSPVEWIWALALGAIATGGQQLMSRAFAAAEVSIVLPLDFLRLPMTALVAYLAFAERPDPWAWAGGAVILGATVFIAHRETRIRSAAMRDRAR